MCRKQLLLVRPEDCSTTRRDVILIHKYPTRHTLILIQLFTLREFLKWTIIRSDVCLLKKREH